MLYFFSYDTSQISYYNNLNTEHCDFFFFFQAEDGIRDGHVTGVQTCALPIFRNPIGEIPDAIAPELTKTSSSPRDSTSAAAFTSADNRAVSTPSPAVLSEEEPTDRKSVV